MRPHHTLVLASDIPINGTDGPGAHLSALPGTDVLAPAGRETVRAWSAVLQLVVVLHRWIPDARWLLVHAVTLGLVGNLVLAWSQHFTESLLKNRLPDDARGRQPARIGLLNAGAALLVAGILTDLYAVVLVASTAAVAGLAVCAVGLGAAALFAFLPLMVSAAWVSVAGRRAALLRTPGEPAPREAPAPAGRPGRESLAGVLAVVLAVAAGVAADPAAAGLDLRGAGEAGFAATGATTTVHVAAQEGMRFEPSSVEVPVGNELVIVLTNDDPTNVHDLVLTSGDGSGRLAPGQSAALDAGVVGGPVDGWCSVAGHRGMGMTFDVAAVDADGRAVEDASTTAGQPAVAGAEPGPAADLGAPPGEGTETRPPSWSRSRRARWRPAGVCTGSSSTSRRRRTRSHRGS